MLDVATMGSEVIEMNDQNKKQSQQSEETPKKLSGASAAKSSSGWRKLFAKRYVSPAIFMAAAAIIVTLMWIYQGVDTSKEANVPSDPSEMTQEGEEVVTGGGEVQVEQEPTDVLAEGETMVWPVHDIAVMQVDTPYYDTKAAAEEKEAALVQIGNQYFPHTGIDIADPNGESFDVMAVLSGKVAYAKKHPTNGTMVEINHGNGLVTVYQSLADVQVEEGTEVEQGTVIGKAGRSELENELGVHLHFEARVNGEIVNPNDFFKSKQ